jgi:phosphate/sulfate permease
MADDDSFPLAGDGTSGTGEVDGSIAGASGTSSGGVVLSHGAMIAIIVVVVVVALFGVATSVLFFVAKKREWTMRETLRRSARKVVTVLTPRRSEFPKSVKESAGGRGKYDDVPPTPRIKPEYLDLEKGHDKPKKKRNFSRK